MNDKSNAAQAIEKVTIDGDEIWVLPAGPNAPEIPGRPGQRVRGWVVVARLCDPFVLKPDGQQQKLKDSPWARTQIIWALDGRSQNRPLFCLNVEAVPMWLATLTPGKVDADVREKLARYQVQASAVLDDWANGRSRIVRADDNHLLQAVLQLGEGVAEIGHGVTALLEANRQTRQELVHLRDSHSGLRTDVATLKLDHQSLRLEQEKLREDFRNIVPIARPVTKKTKSLLAQYCVELNHGQCTYCRTLVADAVQGALDNFEPDHLYTRTKSDIHSLAPSCKPCNRKLGQPEGRDVRHPDECRMGAAFQAKVRQFEAQIRREKETAPGRQGAFDFIA